MKKFAPILIPFFVSLVVALSVIAITTSTSYIALTPDQQVIAEEQRKAREAEEAEQKRIKEEQENEALKQEQAAKVQEILLGDRYEEYADYTFGETVNAGYGTGNYSLEQTIQNYKDWSQQPSNIQITNYAVFRILVGTQRETFSPVTGKNIEMTSVNNNGADTTLIMRDNTTTQSCEITLPDFATTCAYSDPTKDPGMQPDSAKEQETSSLDSIIGTNEEESNEQ